MTDAATRADLKRDLKKIGLGEGDAVYVHSSLKMVGWIDGGIGTLVDAFMDALGRDGTLAVPTHTYSYAGRGAPPYDPVTSESTTGVFPETVRTRPDALRSGHASHSSAAIGARAKYLTENHDPADALGTESPLRRLYEINGKVLLIGVTQSSNTILHLAEMLSGVPYTKLHYDASWGDATHAVTPGGGIVRTAQVRYPGCSGNFNVMNEYLLEAGAMRTGIIGQADSYLMDARPTVEKAVALINGRPDFLLCGWSRCPCCPPRRALLKNLGLI